MFPWILCCILLIVVFFLITKIIFIEKSIDEIHTEFQERLSSDTNTLIDISSSDPHLRKLASEINIQLRLLRKERHRYQQGDLELKEAITNISHDLRTPLTAINGYLDLLEREEKSETVHCYLSQIQNRTDVLKNLTEELFRYSVVTSFQELKPERMDVVRALEEVCCLSMRSCRKKASNRKSNCRRNRFSVNWMQVRSTVSFPTLSAMR